MRGVDCHRACRDTSVDDILDDYFNNLAESLDLVDEVRDWNSMRESGGDWVS